MCDLIYAHNRPGIRACMIWNVHVIETHVEVQSWWQLITPARVHTLKHAQDAHAHMRGSTSTYACPKILYTLLHTHTRTYTHTVSVASLVTFSRAVETLSHRVSHSQS